MTASPIAHAIFDRRLARARLTRAFRAPAAGADFLLTRATQELVERLSLLPRAFACAVDLATPTDAAARALAADPRIDRVIRVAPVLAAAGPAGMMRLVGDDERSPLADASCDLIVSLLALQGANDLPGAMILARRALRPDGLFIACLVGGDSLNELRRSLTIAESEILSGAHPRVSPFAELRDLGSLLQRAGFAMPVVDLDRVVARYDDIVAVMRDLRAMGAASALVQRARKPLRRDVLARAARVYAENFADPDGRLRATFDCIWLSGWAPHESQQKPLKPGSATMRLEDALKGVRT